MKSRTESIQEELERREEEIRLKVESILDEEDEDVMTARIKRLDAHEMDVLEERLKKINEEEEQEESEEDWVSQFLGGFRYYDVDDERYDERMPFDVGMKEIKNYLELLRSNKKRNL